MSKEQGQAEQHGRRLPVWMLSPAEEKEARKNLKTMAYEKCSEYVRAMAECSKAHGLNVFPACDGPKRQMGECLLFYQKDEFLDAEWDRIVERKLDALEQQVKARKAGEQ
ncbi:FAFR201Cp [Eremothecium gossypii FDAG1]|nr:FAFR201Cp [Eremothecium gossypii FDAG1]